MSLFQPLNIRKWVEEHRHELKPPVGNKMVWRDERDTIIMVVGGPNARKDYHVNVTEEFFYQIQGDIILGIINPETGKPEDIIIREGDIYLLPANVPHNPKRPAGTIGLAVEQKRPEGAKDKLLAETKSQFVKVELPEVVRKANDLGMSVKELQKKIELISKGK